MKNDKKGKKRLKVAMIAIAGAAVLLTIAANVSYAPGLRDETGKALKKTNASITELSAIDINGSKQWISVRTQNKEAPVLLFVHGGPGSPETTMVRKYFAGKLEREFVVVCWEQRGSGKSFGAGKGKTLTMDMMLDDADAVVDYLRARFNKRKIYLIGHSFGTTLGTLLVARHPEKIEAFCSIGQVVYGMDNEKVSYAWTMEQAKARNDKKGIKALEAIAGYGDDPRVNWKKYIMTERNWLGVYGGATGHDPSFLNEMIAEILVFSPEYTFMNKVDFLRGSMKSLTDLWPSELDTDLRKEVPGIEVPILMIAGRYDYNTPCTLAEAYFKELAAPKKKFVWFENSAHSPCFEEPAKFADVLTDFFLAGK